MARWLRVTLVLAVLGSASVSPLFHLQQVAGAQSCRVVEEVLPDPVCTPGVIDERVTQDNIGATICVSGYSRSVRPSSSYTSRLKVQQIAEYGYSDTDPRHYEEDHLISLELGGHPTDPRNLWPEPGASPNPKDRIENALHRAICAGRVTLAAAQDVIARDWRQADSLLQGAPAADGDEPDATPPDDETSPESPPASQPPPADNQPTDPPPADAPPPPASAPPPAPPAPPTTQACPVATPISNPWCINPTQGSLITTPPAEFCGYFPCIANFGNGRGYVMECRDGLFGKSGGISGSCSGHGGNRRPWYRP